MGPCRSEVVSRGAPTQRMLATRSHSQQVAPATPPGERVVRGRWPGALQRPRHLGYLARVMGWRLLLLLPVFVLLSTASTAGVFISNLDSVCVRCLCEAASNCNTTVGCHKGYCGPFFISRNYWQDAGSHPLPGDNPNRSEAFQDCATDYDCAVQTVENYMEKHGQDCNGDGVTDCDDFALVHYNGGYECGKSLQGSSFHSRYQHCRPAKFQD